MEEFIGIVKLFAGNFAPKGWALCNGQIMSIAQNTALFSILGTTYGGDGISTFALPNLQGAAPVGVGTDRLGTTYVQGQVGGSSNVTLTTAQLPAHNHTPTLGYNSGNAALAKPTATSVPACPGYTSGRDFVATFGFIEATPDIKMTNTITETTIGQNNPISIMQPYLAMNYIICLEGIFPSRN